MKKISVILIVIFISSAFSVNAFAFDPWTWEDTALEGVFGSFMAMDYSQTIKRSNDFTESNFYLKKNTSDEAALGYFTAALALHAGVAYVLPKPYREMWQGVWIGIEWGTVQHNRKVGAGIALHF